MVKMSRQQSPKKRHAGYITLAAFHMENNSHQSYSSHHQHEPIVTDNYVETIAISFGGMLHIHIVVYNKNVAIQGGATDY